MMTSSNGNIFGVTGPFWGKSTGQRGQWSWTLRCSLIHAWTNGSGNNQDAGGLARHRTHYDATVMTVWSSYRIVDQNRCRWYPWWYILLLIHWIIFQKLALLTYLLLDKMDAISQTIFSDAFSWMKSFVFWLKFQWSLFLRVQLTITQHWFR